MVPSETVQALLAFAGVAIVFLLFYQLFVPGFNKVEKTSEVYFDLAIEKIDAAKANPGETKEISALSSDDGPKYYLIYFGEKNYLELAPKEIFIASSNTPNQLCVCSIDDETIKCDYCKGIEKPITLNENPESEFSILLNKVVKVIFEDGHYKFKITEESNE
jgi:hypothetical protein